MKPSNVLLLRPIAAQASSSLLVNFVTLVIVKTHRLIERQEARDQFNGFIFSTFVFFPVLSTFRARSGWMFRGSLDDGIFSHCWFYLVKVAHVQRPLHKRTLKWHHKHHTGTNLLCCPLCAKKFNAESQLTIHMRVHNGERQFTCDRCEKRFKSKWELQRHELVHSRERPFTCDLCEKRFKSKVELQRHALIHSGDRPFTCNLCEKRFKLKGDLQRHALVHSRERPFTCDLCEKRFKSKVELQRHALVHSGKEAVYLSLMDVVSAEEPSLVLRS
uniref:C2H2-type domain-containing protein n=1 Tax=Neogobius melanostomus TaxID=47308 RepID=A0A8C6WGB8_9GOBI